MDDKHLNLLWLDLETTGSDPEKDQILEVGAFVTNSNFECVDNLAFHRIVRLEVPGFERLMNNEYVRRMHQGNGLLIESMNSSTTLEEVNESIHNFIQRHLIYVEKHDVELIRLAGSGVAAFDKPVVDKQLPLLAEHLIYSSLDVGHIRRFLKYSGASLFVEEDTKTHRALADAKYHHEEALRYREMLKGVL